MKKQGANDGATFILKGLNPGAALVFLLAVFVGMALRNQDVSRRQAGLESLLIESSN